MDSDATLPLVPQPVLVERGTGAPFVLDASTTLHVEASQRETLAPVVADLRAATGLELPEGNERRAAGIRILLSDSTSDTSVATGNGAFTDDESHTLDVAADGVTITARTAHGAFDAVQTLRQLLPPEAASPERDAASWELPLVHVDDAPRFAYRGVMLDVARSFQSTDMVKRFIDTMARLKMSVLHLHLADDQGWRIEITNDGREPDDTIDYTRLTAISGRTAMTQQGHDGEQGHAGFFTQDELRDIVEHARTRFVTVVPEIDVPGHTTAALHAIPELNTARSLPAPDPATGVAAPNGTGDVGDSALDELHEPTYRFVRHVFGQLAEVVGGPLVHVGGDESIKMGHERYVEFVRRAVPDVQAATGVGVMGWSEFAEAGLDQPDGYWDGSVVQYWDGPADGVRDFVAKGGRAVVSRADGSYLDQKYSPETPIGLTWACQGDCDVPRYYDWDPTTTVAGGLAEEEVLGVEAPLWSETIRGEAQALYLALPRAAAVLETGWSRADRKDVAPFLERLGVLGAHWAAAGVNFYATPKVTWADGVVLTDLNGRPVAP